MSQKPRNIGLAATAVLPFLLLVACSDDPPASNNSGGGKDTTAFLPDTSTASDTGAVVDTGGTADTGGAADTGSAADSGPTDTRPTDTGGATDTGAVTDTAKPGDAGGVADTGPADAGGATDTGAVTDTSGAADTGATDTGPSDTGGATDTGAATDTSSNADAGTSTDVTAGCTNGALKRCWVECVQKYPAECIHGDVPPRIPGTQKCESGAWTVCSIPMQCSELATSCTNPSKKAVTQTCLDGSSKQGEFLCTKPLGAKCTTSFWGGYGAIDCPQLCDTTADKCPKAGEKEACSVFCDSPTGATVSGTRTCQAVCNTQVWSTCMTGDGCWKKAGSP